MLNMLSERAEQKHGGNILKLVGKAFQPQGQTGRGWRHLPTTQRKLSGRQTKDKTDRHHPAPLSRSAQCFVTPRKGTCSAVGSESTLSSESEKHIFQRIKRWCRKLRLQVVDNEYQTADAMLPAHQGPDSANGSPFCNTAPGVCCSHTTLHASKARMVFSFFFLFLFLSWGWS